MERRTTDAAKVGVEARDDVSVISGYAAVFYREGEEGTEYRLFDGAVERIDRRAFDRALQEQDDVRALFNHDPNYVLGRTRSGTLRLSVDDVGLRYEIDQPTTTQGEDIARTIERGDVSGSSFAFRADEVDWERRDGADDIRHIRSVGLFDVGPVTFPAYESSTAGARDGIAGEQAKLVAERDKHSAELARRAESKAKRAKSVDIDLANA